MNERKQPPEVVIARWLIEKKITLAVAESCTGGLITHRLTNVPGSSGFLVVGIIAYAYEAKVNALGVSWDTLKRYGAVSEETVTEMAQGVRQRFACTLGLAVTGIAGPGGSTPEKPVGLTYIALASESDRIVEKHVWRGNRVENKSFSADAALALLFQYLAQ